VKVAISEPFGVGKGTQEGGLTPTTLANRARISTGSLLRERMRSNTGVGRGAKRSYCGNEPVPGGVATRPVLSQPRSVGFGGPDDESAN